MAALIYVGKQGALSLRAFEGCAYVMEWSGCDMVLSPRGGTADCHPKEQVSTHVALDHQTYSALAQQTQITWTAVLKCDEPSRVGRWRLCYITYQSNIHIWTTRPAGYEKSKH